MMNPGSMQRQGFGVLLAGMLLGGASFAAAPHVWAQGNAPAGETQGVLSPAATELADGELTADGVCVSSYSTNAVATCDSEMPGDDPLGVDQPPTSSSFGDDGPFSGGE